ncbi:hypothetical protein SCALM49S_01248 [Streptomyces californicus]
MDRRSFMATTGRASLLAGGALTAGAALTAAPAEAAPAHDGRGHHGGGRTVRFEHHQRHPGRSGRLRQGPRRSAPDQPRQRRARRGRRHHAARLRLRVRGGPPHPPASPAPQERRVGHRQPRVLRPEVQRPEHAGPGHLAQRHHRGLALPQLLQLRGAQQGLHGGVVRRGSRPHPRDRALRALPRREAVGRGVDQRRAVRLAGGPARPLGASAQARHGADAPPPAEHGVGHPQQALPGRLPPARPAAVDPGPPQGRVPLLPATPTGTSTCRTGRSAGSSPEPGTWTASPSSTPRRSRRGGRTTARAARSRWRARSTRASRSR